MSNAVTSTKRFVSASVSSFQRTGIRSERLKFDMTKPCTGANCIAEALIAYLNPPQDDDCQVYFARMPNMRRVLSNDRISKLVVAGFNSITLVAHPYMDSAVEKAYTAIDLHKSNTYTLTCLAPGSEKFGLFSSYILTRRFLNAVCSGASKARPLFVDDLPGRGPLVPQVPLSIRNMNDEVVQFVATATTTGAEVKMRYFIETEFPVDYQVMTVNSTVIRDAFTLEEQGIDGTTEIRVLRAMRREDMGQPTDFDEIVVKLVVPGGKQIQVHVPAKATVEEIVQYALAKDKLNDNEFHLSKLYEAMAEKTLKRKRGTGGL